MKENKFIKQQDKETLEFEEFNSGGDYELITDEEKVDRELVISNHEEEILYCLSKLLNNIAAVNEEEDEQLIELEPGEERKNLLVSEEDERRENFINTEEEKRSDFLITEKDESGDLVIDDSERNWDLVIDEFKTEDEKGWHYRPEPVFGDLVDAGKEDTKTKSISTLAAVLLAGGGALVLGLASVGVASLVKGYRLKKSKESVVPEQEPELKTLPAAGTREVKQMPEHHVYPPQPEAFKPIKWQPLRLPLFYHPHAG
ncbi:MAG: hypothetical protein H0Z40_10100 [Desulfotomaculum sp.]|nr:hypothetical protein [Desulfotomaculum sp.]